jgi:hypothetical protein
MMIIVIARHTRIDKGGCLLKDSRMKHTEHEDTFLSLANYMKKNGKLAGLIEETGSLSVEMISIWDKMEIITVRLWRWIWMKGITGCWALIS